MSHAWLTYAPQARIKHANGNVTGCLRRSCNSISSAEILKRRSERGVCGMLSSSTMSRRRLPEASFAAMIYAEAGLVANTNRSPKAAITRRRGTRKHSAPNQPRITSQHIINKASGSSDQHQHSRISQQVCERVQIIAGLAAVGRRDTKKSSDESSIHRGRPPQLFRPLLISTQCSR